MAATQARGSAGVAREGASTVRAVSGATQSVATDTLTQRAGGGVTAAAGCADAGSAAGALTGTLAAGPASAESPDR